MNKKQTVFQKSLKKDSRYSFLRFFRIERYFTRPLAYLIVRAVKGTSVTPNQITLFSFFLGVAGSLALMAGTPSWFIVGGSLIQLSSIFDCADGQLARVKNQCSRYGAFLDLFLDRISDFIFLSAITIGQFRYDGDLVFFIFAVFGVGLYLLQVSLFYLTNWFYDKEDKGSTAEERGLTIFMIFIFSIFNHLKVLVIILFITVISLFIHKIVVLIQLRKHSG